LSIDENYLFAYEYLALCYKKLGINNEALKYAEKVLGFDPNNRRAREIIKEIRK